MEILVNYQWMVDEINDSQNFRQINYKHLTNLNQSFENLYLHRTEYLFYVL